MDTPAPKNTLFVGLPDKKTFAIRQLDHQITLESLRAKIELVTGLHGSSFQVTYGDITIDDDVELVFDQNIRNGGVVKLILPPVLCNIERCISDGHVQEVTRLVSTEDPSGTADGSESGLTSKDKLFFSLLLTCGSGHLTVLKALTKLDRGSLWKRQCTKHGRTLVHVAASSDQAKVISYLIDEGAPLHVQDVFHSTPLDIAVAQGAYTCERLIKHSMMHSKKPKKESRRVCWGQDSQYTKTAPGTNYLPKKLPYSAADQHSKPSWSADMVSGSVVSGTSLASSRQGSPHGKCSPKPRSTSAKSSVSLKTSKSKENQAPHSHPVQPRNRQVHPQCANRPPFMAYRTVTPEELRPLAVEFVPLDTITYDQRQVYNTKQAPGDSAPCPAAPCSSLNNSRENLNQIGNRTHASSGGESSNDESEELNEKEKILQKREELRRRYSNVRKYSLRSQSAKYYRTQYHQDDFDGIVVPKARPSTAGSRYREWKTWLLEKMEQDAEKEFIKENNAERRAKNEKAFKKWLRRKKREELHDDDSSDDEDDSSSSGYDEENERAYRRWLEKKKDVFDKMDKNRRQELTQDPDALSKAHGKAHKDKRVTIYELGAFSDKPVPSPRPDQYMRAFQTWKETRTKYENWKKRKGIQDSPRKPPSKEDIIKMRGTLLLEGITYQEWLGLKERENAVPKLNVYNVGKDADLSRRKRTSVK